MPKKWTSPLCLAYQRGRDSPLQLFLGNGSDIYLCNKNGDSPLHRACCNGHLNIVKHLLKNGADNNIYKKNGASPLFLACQKGHDSTLHLLLSNGAGLNWCKKNGISSLYAPYQTEKIALYNFDWVMMQTLMPQKWINILYEACYNWHDSTV